MDRQTGWIQYTPPNFVAEGIISTSPANHKPANFWFFLHWQEIVKSGAISGWTDEDQLLIWSYHSSSTNNHLNYLLIYNGNVTSNNFNIFQQVTQDKLM